MKETDTADETLLYLEINVRAKDTDRIQDTMRMELEDFAEKIDEVEEMMCEVQEEWNG